MDPNTYDAQMREEFFVPDHSIAVFFATSKFDKVGKIGKGGDFEQGYTDLTEAKNDCKQLRDCLQKYKIRDPKDIYNLDNDPTEKEIRMVCMDIEKRLK